jgi:serine/threonine protein kinase/WD40 repeat protein
MESRSEPPETRGRAESFRALSDLLRWAYGTSPKPFDPPSTQGDPDGDRSNPGGLGFDATQWEEKSTPRFAAPGERLGRFTIGTELGRGGFGIVYLAVDTRLGREVALKLPRPDRVQNAAIWGRFAREARLAAGLDHEAIVPVLDAGLIDGTFYLATAYQRGEPLSRWITRFPEGVSARVATTLMERLAAGLAYAHGHGVLHRDLKPGNVLMVSAGGRSVGDGESAPIPRITDFGLGTYSDVEDTGTLTGFWLGTPPYMAPEQVLPDRGPVDARADVYALGAIFYELLTGRPIYDCQTIWALSVQLSRGEPPVHPRHFRRDVPRDLETICLKCLDHAPERRYGSAAELHADLSRFLQGVPVLARPRPAWARLGLWARRNPGRAGLLGGIVAAVLLVAGLVTWHQASLSASNNRLNLANRELESTVATLKSTMDNLRATELAKRRTSYAADLQLAAREIEAGQVALAQSTLRQQCPTPEQDDVRDFTWRLLWKRATRPYKIAPLYDFSWWKTKAGGALPTRKQIDRLLSGQVVLDPRAISSNSLGETSLYNGGFSRFFILDDRGQDLKSLWRDDGKRELALDLPRARPSLGLDGRTLALSDFDWIALSGEAPPLKVSRLDPATGDPADASTAQPRVVEVPAALAMNFSGDGRTLALQAHTPEGPLVPIFYDLESGRGASFPSQAFDPEIGKKLPGQANMRDRGLTTRMVLSADGRLAARTDWSPRVCVFDTATGKTRWVLDAKKFGEGIMVNCLAFSPDGKGLVTGDTGGDVRVWSVADGALRARFPSNLGFVRVVGWYPDARTVAIIAGGEDAIRFWEYHPEPPPPDTMHHGSEVWDLAFLDGGTILASAGDDHRIRLWDALRSKPLQVIEDRGILVSTLAAEGRGGQMYSGDYSGRIRVHTLKNGTLSKAASLTLPRLEGNPIRAMARSPDGRYLAASGTSTDVWIRDTVEGRDRSLSPPHRNNIYAMAFSPDGRTLAVGSDNKTITLWELPGFILRATIPTLGEIACLAFASDSDRFAGGDSEGRIQFWRRSSQALDGTVERGTETGGVWDIAFSPDGLTLASGGDDGTVRLWDPASKRELAKLTGHARKVHAVAFSPDGLMLASADFAGVILIHRAAKAED